MTPRVDCHFSLNLIVTVVRGLDRLPQNCGYTSPCEDLYGAARFIRPLAGWRTPEVAGLGGTNLHLPSNKLITKHNLFIMKELCFETP